MSTISERILEIGMELGKLDDVMKRCETMLEIYESIDFYQGIVETANKLCDTMAQCMVLWDEYDELCNQPYTLDASKVNSIYMPKEDKWVAIVLP